MNDLHIVKLQRFSTHDGPGIRTVVFVKGCPLRCAWCHNPETQSERDQIFFHARDCIGCGACASVCRFGAHTADPQGMHVFDVTRCIGCAECARACPSGALEAVGERRSVEQVLATVLRDRDFYGTEGGLTLSGGEPMAQPEASLSLLRAAKREGISTAVETCGMFPSEYVSPLAQTADLLLWDLKDGDPERHRRYTGASPERILQNLYAADRLGCRILLRCIMVKTVNMDETNYAAIANTASRLQNCIGVELIPYHAYGGSKARQLGGTDNGRTDWIPTPEDLQNARRFLEEKGCLLFHP